MGGGIDAEGFKDDKVKVTLVMDRACRDEAVGMAVRECERKAFCSTLAPSLNLDLVTPNTIDNLDTVN